LRVHPFRRSLARCQPVGSDCSRASRRERATEVVVPAQHGDQETGLTFSASPIFVTPGEEVVVTVVNKSDVLIRFLEKMAVARVVFIEAPELKPTA
jgi:hypothetical protein